MYVDTRMFFTVRAIDKAVCDAWSNKVAKHAVTVASKVSRVYVHRYKCEF